MTISIVTAATDLNLAIRFRGTKSLRAFAVMSSSRSCHFDADMSREKLVSIFGRRFISFSTSFERRFS
jgi:hypothetical protein